MPPLSTLMYTVLSRGKAFHGGSGADSAVDEVPRSSLAASAPHGPKSGQRFLHLELWKYVTRNFAKGIFFTEASSDEGSMTPSYET